MQLAPTTPLVYLWTNLSINERGSVGVTQSYFIGRTPGLALSDFRSASPLYLRPSDVRARFRLISGLFARMLQTQHHIDSPVTKSATDSPRRCLNAEEFAGMVVTSNKIITSVKSRPLVLRYRLLFGPIPSNAELRTLNAMSFSCFGFATMWDSESIDASMIILPTPLSRDGENKMKGQLLDGGAREIVQTARSTIAGETISL